MGACEPRSGGTAERTAPQQSTALLAGDVRGCGQRGAAGQGCRGRRASAAGRNPPRLPRVSAWQLPPQHRLRGKAAARPLSARTCPGRPAPRRGSPRGQGRRGAARPPRRLMRNRPGVAAAEHGAAGAAAAQAAVLLPALRPQPLRPPAPPQRRRQAAGKAGGVARRGTGRGDGAARSGDAGRCGRQRRCGRLSAPALRRRARPSQRYCRRWEPRGCHQRAVKVSGRSPRSTSRGVRVREYRQFESAAAPPRALPARSAAPAPLGPPSRALPRRSTAATGQQTPHLVKPLQLPSFPGKGF